MKFKFYLAVLSILISFGLAARTAQAGSATVSWNANTEPDLAGYNIYYGTTPRTGTCPSGGNGGYASKYTAGNITSYTFYNLTDGQTYYFSVTAYDTGGLESCFSSEVSKIVAPQNITCDATISWNANTEPDLAGYRVYYGTSPRLSTCPPTAGYANNLDVGNVTSHTFSGLISGQTYYFSVSAYDTGGLESCFTAEVSKAVSCGTPPVNNDPTGSFDAADAAHVSGWAYDSDSGTNPISVDIYDGNRMIARVLANMARSDLTAAIGDPNHAFNFRFSGQSSLTQGTHTIHIYAINSPAGNNPELSGSPKIITVSAQIDTEAPTSPADLWASAVSAFQINLVWTASDDNFGVTGYRIFRDGIEIGTTPNPSYQNTGLTAMTRYSYKVTAYDAAGNQSAPSLVAAATTLSENETAPLAIISATALSITADSAVINWATNIVSDSQVQYGQTAAYGSQTGLDSAMVISHSQSLSGLTANTTYHYRVKSKDALGNLVTSADYNFTTAAPGQGNYPYTDLGGLPGAEVDRISRLEAELIYYFNKFVALNKAEINLYFSFVRNPKNILTSRDKFAIAYFLHNGTQTTVRLGAGERAGVLNSFKEAYGKLPQSIADWQDVIKIANGRWPSKISNNAESRAMINFRKIYLRLASSGNNAEMNAIKILAYGLRPVNRNMASERAAITTFISIYRHAPATAGDWDIIRTIANSGVSR